MIGDRIKSLRKQLKLSQKELADSLKINASAISQMESNKIKPSLQTLALLAKAHGVNLHWMITGKGPMFGGSGATVSSTERRLDKIRSFINDELAILVKSKEELNSQDVVDLRVVGEIAAGLPAESIDTSMDVISMRRSMINGEEEDYIALRVNGHSMEPMVCNNDLVVIRRSQDWESATGNICALRIDGAITLKRLSFDARKKLIVLLSLNEEYQPLLFNPQEHQDITLIGMLHYLYRKM
ncbi:MAG: XRE family transcriptional regulator [Candidatus Syntrophosphaera sp.]|nr:XRE family transcriptional regulator [Candidatus Syntrophosphaera sp.]